jgi:hypothetical protein
VPIVIPDALRANPIEGPKHLEEAQSYLEEAQSYPADDVVFLVDWQTDTGPYTKIHVVEGRESLLTWRMSEPIMMRCGVSVIPGPRTSGSGGSGATSLYGLMKTNPVARGDVCKLCRYYENRDYMDVLAQQRMERSMRSFLPKPDSFAMIRNIT